MVVPRRLLILVAVATVLLVVTAPAASARTHSASVDTDTPRAERAIAWFHAHIGSTAWEGLCELAVESSFGTAARYADARANWNSGTEVLHRDWRKAPRGALVFWNTSAHAHAAISLGDGTVLTTSAGGRIGRVNVTWFQHPLGWKRADWG